MIAKEIEFIALQFPLPDAELGALKRLGELACKARAQAGSRVVQTEDGQALADFESRLRDQIGVLHRRERFGCGGANASHP